jgi:hypothetical protein
MIFRQWQQCQQICLENTTQTFSITLVFILIVYWPSFFFFGEVKVLAYDQLDGVDLVGQTSLISVDLSYEYLPVILWFLLIL